MCFLSVATCLKEYMTQLVSLTAQLDEEGTIQSLKSRRSNTVSGVCLWSSLTTQSSNTPFTTSLFEDIIYNFQSDQIFTKLQYRFFEDLQTCDW